MTYNFAYGENTPYARAVALVAEHRSPAGNVVVDLGCGYGAIAEPLCELGLGYLGVDLELSGVKALVDRGMEAIVGDLSTPGELIDEVEQALEGRQVAAICMLDVIEHLTNADVVLEEVRRFAHANGGPPLVVSIPNVTHLDLAVKLLMGRWDVTPTGLLDSTHVRFFSGSSLTRSMRRAGWTEIAINDFALIFSDQHFPADAVPLERGTLLGSLLTDMRQGADSNAFVNQFVRAYLPSAGVLDEAGARAPDLGGPRPDTSPFLSVIVRTTGERRGTLSETLLSLAAQTCTDFEVLVMAHNVTSERLSEIEAEVREFHPSFSRRVRVIAVNGGGRSRPLNEGARTARGSYLAVLDDDDVAFAHWVESLAAAAARAPAKVLRVGVARQRVVEAPGGWDGEDGYEIVSKPHCEYPLHFDQVEHMLDNRTPPCGFAVPRSLFEDLGMGWDERLAVYEDWEYLMRAASVCGVECTPTVAALMRVWLTGDCSRTIHSEDEWAAARAAVVSGFDSRPLVMGKGSMTRIRELLKSEKHAHERISELEQALSEHSAALAASEKALSELQHDLADVRTSTSWRFTALPRFVSGMARRTARHLLRHGRKR